MVSKFLSVFVICLVFVSSSSTNSFAQQDHQKSTSVEKGIGYAKGPLGSKLDYQLVPTENRKFALKIINSKESKFSVKIYDIIGNLIMSDKLSEDQNGEKEYDFSDRKTKIFVVKVDAGEENLTKKVTI